MGKRIGFRIPTVELKIPGKIIFEIRNHKFCYIQVIDFDLSYLPVAAVGTQQVRFHEKIVINIFSIFHYFFMVADLLSPNRWYWWIAKVKIYNLNVTEVLVSDFKNVFPEFSASPSESYRDPDSELDR